MRRRVPFLALSAVVAAGVVFGTMPAVVADTFTATTTSTTAGSPSDEHPAVSRGLIVKTSGDASSAGIARTADAALPGDREVARTTALPGGLEVVRFDDTVSTATAAQVAKDVQDRGDVTWAVPDQRRYVENVGTTTDTETANDELYQTGEQYNINDSAGYGTNAETLWGATTGAGVVVAVVDTGILADHPDLAGQTVAGYDFVSDPTYSNDGDGRDADPTDPGDYTTDGECGSGEDAESSSWHGSHVAGIIAATRNNTIGVSGIAPGVKIEPVRVLGACGGYDSDIIVGIEWASGATIAGVPTNQHPAQVINLSVGSTYTAAQSSYETAACQLYATAAEVAKDNGAIVVAAAGNDGSDVAYDVPGSCTGYLTVASTGRTGHAAYYSNTGAGVDISAPGGDELVDGTGIWSTIDSGTTTETSSTYGQMQGTSMATPAVSAAAALLYSLGIHDPTALTAAVEASVQSFAGSTANGVNWSQYSYVANGKRYRVNLSCTTSRCGSGILDLSQVPAPLGTAAITGTAAPGSTVTVNSTWVGPSTVTKRIDWYVGGQLAQSGTSASYLIPAAGAGKSIRAVIAPASGAYSAISTTTASRTISSPVAAVKPIVRTTSKVKGSMASRVKRFTRTRLKATITSKATTRPTGTVRVRIGSRTIASGTVKTSAKGVVTLTLPGMHTGLRTLTIVYSGSTTVKSSSSTVKVRVY